MKKHLLPFALLALGLPATAQTSPPEEGCNIRYQYDAAGNRIQRDWYCWGNEVQSPTEPGSTAEETSAKRLLAEIHMNVFPNPASETAKVTFTSDVPFGNLELLDASGRSVWRASVAGTNAILKLQEVETGTYWLVFRAGDERIVTALSVTSAREP